MNKRLSRTPTLLPVAAQEQAPGLPTQLRTVRDELLTDLVERDVAVRLALLAALAGEHLLLLGPPGTAKSLVARRLHHAFTDGAYFERLLTRFTVPEELFGPLSIKGLEEDRYERLLEGYLPAASIAFIDEIFKANSAILNALLTMLNEREFDNGRQRIKTPLVAVVAASNELPEGEELDALYDRFLLRVHVGSVSGEGFKDLIRLRGSAEVGLHESLRLSPIELAGIRSAAEHVDVPEDVEALLCELRDWCAAEEIVVSDRRWRKVVHLLQVAAGTNGRATVSIWDCWLLQHCLWSRPEQREKLQAWYEARVGTSAAMDPSRLTKLVTAWEAQLTKDKESRSQVRDEEGRYLYEGVGRKASVESEERYNAERGGETLFLAPPQSWVGSYGESPITDRTNGGRGYTQGELKNLSTHHHQKFANWPNRDAYLADPNNRLVQTLKHPPLMEPTRQKPAYIEQSLRDVDELKASVLHYLAKLSAHVQALENDIRGHLWVTPDFVAPAMRSLNQIARTVATLLSRVDQLRQGFEMLPREDQPTPAPTKPKKR